MNNSNFTAKNYTQEFLEALTHLEKAREILAQIASELNQEDWVCDESIPYFEEIDRRTNQEDNSIKESIATIAEIVRK